MIITAVNICFSFLRLDFNHYNTHSATSILYNEISWYKLLGKLPSVRVVGGVQLPKQLTIKENWIESHFLQNHLYKG